MSVSIAGVGLIIRGGVVGSGRAAAGEVLRFQGSWEEQARRRVLRRREK